MSKPFTLFHFAVLLATLSISSCGSKQPRTVASKQQEAAVNDESSQADEYFEQNPALSLEKLIASGLNEERIRDLYAHIPNPNTFDEIEKVNDYFTERMERLLKESFNIPSDEFDGIGSFEVLFELNGGNIYGSPKYMGYRLTSLDQSCASVIVYLGAEAGNDSITMQIKEENGLWKIDELSTSSIMLDYIAKERAFFQSEEWENNCSSYQVEINSCDDPQERERMQNLLDVAINGVKIYFEKYPLQHTDQK